MLRDIDEKLIAPDSLLQSTDLAKLGCNNCKGCSDCCKDRAELITLDAFDVKLLKEHLNYSFTGLMDQGFLTLSVVDGVILPCLSVKESKDECIFLGSDSRCQIHEFRPGICRMFPLARIWHEDGSFSYFLQEGECTHGNGVKIRISKWLEYPDLKGYENDIREYHDALRLLRKDMEKDLSHEEQVQLQKLFLETWFL